MFREPECEGALFRGDEASTGLEEAVEDQDREATSSVGAWTVAGVDDTIHAGSKISPIHEQT
jgi:hypothetical protein